jgi:hypothetical protein
VVPLIQGIGGACSRNGKNRPLSLA